ncbi:hypothetical protein ABCR94_00555 [Streptomyces sp. 21So2-11]|uniref:hypothetical protein n=1 Tax=Streptomyces sp. 21So2-11 TaxID=3144408 RepID=UPI00321A7F65
MTSAGATDSQPPNAISLMDLHLLAERLADQLGVWNVVDDFEPSQDSTIHLVAADRRAIGIRHLFNGQAVQAFAIGGTALASPAGTAKATASGPRRLAEGVRYSTGVTFTSDEAPLESILTAIRTVLLPAFDGHRSPMDSRTRRLTPPPSTNSAPVELAPSKTEAEAKNTPKARTRKSSTTRTTGAKPGNRTPRKKATATA